MGLKNDWSLANTLYYLSVTALCISVLLVVLLVFAQIQSNGILIANLPFVDEPILIENLEFDHAQLLSNAGTHIMPIKMYAHTTLFEMNGYFTTMSYQLFFVRLIRLLMVVYFLYLLANILQSIRRLNPFDRKNSSRILSMGVLVILISITKILFSITYTRFLNETGFQSDLSFSFYTTNYTTWFFGLVLILFSFVYKEATRFHEEQKLVV